MSQEPGPTSKHELIIPVVTRPDYVIGLERPGTGMTFVHGRVNRWSHTVLRSMAADVATLREMHGGPFFAMGRADDRAHQKFTRAVGFVLVGGMPSLPGPLINLYIRT